ncbi:MAG: hypothetical protein ACTHNU_07355 [Gaiellales bacterium]
MDPTIPPISVSQMPPEVQKTGSKGEQMYSAALSFEGQLVQQMAQELASTAQDDSSNDNSSDPSDDAVSSAGSDATTQMYTSMLPDQLTQGVIGAGGTGMALDMWRVMWQAQGGSLGAPAQGGASPAQGSGS